MSMRSLEDPIEESEAILRILAETTMHTYDFSERIRRFAEHAPVYPQRALIIIRAGLGYTDSPSMPNAVAMSLTAPTLKSPSASNAGAGGRDIAEDLYGLATGLIEQAGDTGTTNGFFMLNRILEERPAFTERVFTFGQGLLDNPRRRRMGLDLVKTTIKQDTALCERALGIAESLVTCDDRGGRQEGLRLAAYVLEVRPDLGERVLEIARRDLAHSASDKCVMCVSGLYLAEEVLKQRPDLAQQVVDVLDHQMGDSVHCQLCHHCVGSASRLLSRGGDEAAAPLHVLMSKVADAGAGLDEEHYRAHELPRVVALRDRAREILGQGQPSLAPEDQLPPPQNF